MAAFRIVDPFEVFTDNLGNPCAGGSLVFYDTLTTTAKNVYSDQALSVNLGNTLTLNSAGRATTDVWGSGTYRVLLKNSAGVTQEDVDPILEQGAVNAAIPAQTGNTGKFVTTNGSVMSWATVVQVPDMTGQGGKVLGNNGTAALWQSAASAVTDAVLLNVRETQQTVVAAAATTINFALGAVVKLTQAVDATITLSGAPIAGQAATLTIFRVKDNSGTARAITWPASVVWLSGSPTLPQTANAVTAFTLITFDAGTTWYGTHSA